MRYYIIAGEASGDLHGSNLMKGLYAEDPKADIRFWGGPMMEGVFHEKQKGTGLVKDYREGAVMGLWEVLKNGNSLLKNVRRCKEDILSWKPDVVILIDYPGFNFRIAEFAHKAGFKVYYYIAPKVWASREGRIRKLKAYVDRLFIVFPFEKPYFQAKGVPFVYEGNPLVDAIDQSPAMQESRAEYLSRTGLPDKPWIALLAGSRGFEISHMMPILMEFADKWHASHPDYHFVVAAAPERTQEDYSRYLGERDYVHVVFGETYGTLRHAEAAVINSGTASLEAALIGTPQVVGYRLNPVSAAIMLKMIKVKYISLANLIIDRPAFKELIQNELTSQALMEEMGHILEDAAYRERMLKDYADVRAQLGGAGASAAVARAMVETLKA